MCKLFSNLFVLWALIDLSHSRTQSVLGLNELNATKELATGLEQHVWSERGIHSSQQLWSAAATLFVTSLLAASFTALKIFVAQTLLVSKLSLVGATLLALKAAYDHLRHRFQKSANLPWEVDAHPLAAPAPLATPLATPLAWEHAPQVHEEEDVHGLAPGIAKTMTHHDPLAAGSVHDVTVRSDHLRPRYPPNLSVEYDTIIKKTTYLD